MTGNSCCKINPTSFRLKNLIAFITLFCYLPLFSQPTALVQDSITSKDSAGNQLSELIKMMAEQELVHSISNYQSNTTILLQDRNFVRLQNEIQNAQNFLKKGYDFNKTNNFVNQLIRWKEIATEGVTTNKDSFQTLRNLDATSILLSELSRRTEMGLNDTREYHKFLGTLQYKIDSLAKDSILYEVPRDSAALNAYFQRLIFLKSGIDPVNIKIRSALDSIQKLENQLYIIKFSLEKDIIETEELRKASYGSILSEDRKIISQNSEQHKSLKEIISYSLGKSKLAFDFYLFNHQEKFILMLLSLIIMVFYLRLLVRKTTEANIFEKLKNRTLLLSYPTVSAIVITITIFQFFLPTPPIIISGILWFISAIALSLIVKRSIIKIGFYLWLLFLLLFTFAILDNLILRQTAFESLAILINSILGLVAGFYYLFNKKGKELKIKAILIPMIVMMVFQAIAIIFNLTGNYDMAKGYMRSGFITIVIAFLILWTARFLMGIYHITSLFLRSNEDEKHLHYFEKIDRKLPFFMHLAAGVAWFVLIARNTYSYQAMVDPLEQALFATRTIGKFSYTYESIFIFFIILFLSGIISRIVSFFAADSTPYSKSTKSGGLGSYILLVRLAIITSGALLAFVAAGIPMDRLSIIIGALGVGIGFGLQTLVNNLVSGLIIAFEKPINVDDIVEISGQTGKMKSIGIRSSVVTTYDGADVIIPNGDLINQHLINWTLGSTRRRFDVRVGVAYGTNLDQTKNLILDLMKNDDRILKNPEPFVLVTEFNNSSIDLAVKFWVRHFNFGFEVKSDLIIAIDKLFKEHGIVIPFPQQDLHIRSNNTRDEQI